MEQQELTPPARNLLTHFDETLSAMAEIEGAEWLSYQGESDADRRYQNAAVAKKKLLSGRMHSHFVIEGAMVNRWLVMPDGRVVFLESVKAGSAADAARARTLGFEVRTSEL